MAGRGSGPCSERDLGSGDLRHRSEGGHLLAALVNSLKPPASGVLFNYLEPVTLAFGSKTSQGGVEWGWIKM